MFDGVCDGELRPSIKVTHRDLAFWQTDDCKKYPHDVIRLAPKRSSSARTASRAATQSSPCFSTLEYRYNRRAERMQLQLARAKPTKRVFDDFGALPLIVIDLRTGP